MPYIYNSAVVKCYGNIYGTADLGDIYYTASPSVKIFEIEFSPLKVVISLYKYGQVRPVHALLHLQHVATVLQPRRSSYLFTFNNLCSAQPK